MTPQQQITDLQDQIARLQKQVAQLEYEKKIVQQQFDVVTDLPLDVLVCVFDKQRNLSSYNRMYEKYVFDTWQQTINQGGSFENIYQHTNMYEHYQNGLTEAFNGLYHEQSVDYGEHTSKMYRKTIFKPIFNADGSVNAVAIFETDITEQKQMQKAWNALLEISEESGSASSLRDLLKTIHKEISKMVQAQNFFVALYDEQTSTYTFPYFADRYELLDSYEGKPLTNSLTDYVRRTGLPYLSSAMEEQRLLETHNVAPLGKPALSWLGVPLKTRGSVIGVMALQSYTDEGLYSEKDLEMMTFVSDHIAGAVESKRSEEALRDSQERLRTVMQSLQAGIRLIDVESHTITDLNHSAADMMGSDINTLIGKSCREYVCKNGMHCTCEVQTAVQNIETVVIHASGNVTPVIKNVTPVFVKGRKHLLETLVDIREQKKNQEELKKAKLKAEESDTLKSAFLANMSHEIRTPMNAIIGFSRLLADPELPYEQRQEYNQYIISSGNNLLKIIDDILDVAKIEARQIVIEKTTCAVNRMLDELMLTFQKQKVDREKEHIDLLLKKAEPDRDFTIVTDPNRLRQVISNLISNALKFTENGFVEFGYTFRDAQTLQFYVRDSGIGIPEDKMDLLFSRFGRVEGAKIKDPGGTGLGLSICKDLVELMNGTIWVKTSPYGSTFFFTLPIEVVQNINAVLAQPLSVLQTMNKEIRILIVEDNPINQILITDTLQKYNKKAVVDLAANGRFAVEILNSGKLYDIIIMDVRMPEMDGYQTTRYIRNQMPEPARNMPILGLSAHAMKEEKQRCLETGMNDYITKPFNPEELMRKIDELTGQSTNINETTQTSTVTETQKYKYLNLTLLEKTYNGNQEKINKILNLCLVNIEQQVAELQTRYEQKNWKSVRVVSHSLKTSLNYLGLNELKDIAKEIEKNAADEINFEQIQTGISRIKNDWVNVAQEIQQIVGV